VTGSGRRLQDVQTRLLCGGGHAPPASAAARGCLLGAQIARPLHLPPAARRRCKLLERISGIFYVAVSRCKPSTRTLQNSEFLYISAHRARHTHTYTHIHIHIHIHIRTRTPHFSRTSLPDLRWCAFGMFCLLLRLHVSRTTDPSIMAIAGLDRAIAYIAPEVQKFHRSLEARPLPRWARLGPVYDRGRLRSAAVFKR
jgi:hypothetical protein